MAWRWRNPLGLVGAWAVAVLLTGTALRADDDTGTTKPKTAAEIDHWIINEIKDRAEVEPNLTYLSDIIGPRMTGSANLKRANDWTAEKFKEYGLENVKLEPWEIPVGWERGFVHLRMVEPNNGKDLTAASMAWTPGTKGRFVGEVIVVQAKDKEELEQKYKGKLKNAILMLAPPSNVMPITEIGKPREQRQPGQQRPAPDKQGQPIRRQFQGAGNFAIRQLVQEMAKQEGAACVLQDSAKPHGLLNMTGSWPRDRVEGASERLPTVFIVHDHYAMLYRLATRKDATPPKVEVEIQAKFVPGPIAVYNTVGEIKGTEKPDEFVVIGAHLDSWDLGQGTTDNGTGSTVVLESARTLGKLAKMGVRPKRTIRFVLFTGEEEGLHGSREYVKRHKDEMPKTSMALVHDTGTGRVQEIPIQGFESGSAKATQVKDLLNEELPAVKELNVEIKAGTQGGTDHLSFIPAGVPGFAFKQDPAEYYLTHHSQSDTLDKARWPDIKQGAQVMSIAAMRVANMHDLLPRTDPSAQRRGGFGGGRPPGKAEQKTETKNEAKKPPEKDKR